MAKYTGVLDYIYDFQTLITGVAAVAAALIATRYSRRQIKLSTRELLINRSKALSRRRHEITKDMQHVVDLQRHIKSWENETVEPSPMWAHDSEKTIAIVLVTLEAQQETSFDGASVDRSRRTLISSCKQVESCLYDIHAIQSIGFSGFEEPSEADRPAYQARADKAATELDGLLSHVLKSAKLVDQAFDERLRALRRELHDLEDIAFKGW